MIDAKNLYKSYGRKTYLKDVSIKLEKGRALAVVGDNGAGKTTLLKILATASRPDSGTLMIDGIDALCDPAKAREKIGYVPQGIALMQELSVGDNLRYWMKDKDTAHYRRTLEIIGLADAEKRKVSKLSGGMQRRLNIGASLVLTPSVLILDEPLAGVDSANRQSIIAHLNALKQSGMTIVFTSHYFGEMQTLADTLIALRDGKTTYFGDSDFSGSGKFADFSSAVKYYTS